jgi:hypothetical protein
VTHIRNTGKGTRRLWKGKKKGAKKEKVEMDKTFTRI